MKHSALSNALSNIVLYQTLPAFWLGRTADECTSY